MIKKLNKFSETKLELMYAAEILFGQKGINNKDEKEGRNGPYHRAAKGFMGQTWDGGDIAFNKDFWKVIRVKDSNSINIASDYPDASAILLENFKEGQPGGTGSSFNWELLRNIKSLDMKIIVSGGINIKNVHNAININPWCIDINSGVESFAGVKDLKLINEIIEVYRDED